MLVNLTMTCFLYYCHIYSTAEYTRSLYDGGILFDYSTALLIDTGWRALDLTALGHKCSRPEHRIEDTGSGGANCFYQPISRETAIQRKRVISEPTLQCTPLNWNYRLDIHLYHYNCFWYSSCQNVHSEHDMHGRTHMYGCTHARTLACTHASTPTHTHK